MRIALLPLDERPVNTQLPQQVAAAAGGQLDLPPTTAMPAQRKPADTTAIADWLTEVEKNVDALVVSIDLLAHGGLIPSRLGPESAGPALARLDLLRGIRRRRPELPILGFSVLLRASDSYIATEEPEYWPAVGRELHRLGAELHEDYLARLAGGTGRPVGAGIPAGDRADFVRRRIRNHQVNLEAVRLLGEGVLDCLLLTVDDTAPRSYGALEQDWLRHWGTALGIDRPLLLYAGADEVGAILVARSATIANRRDVRFRVHCVEGDGLARIPKYENSPLDRSLDAQLRAAGAVRVVEGDADIALVVHAPDPAIGDWCAAEPPAKTPAALVDETADALGRLAGQIPVALADLRFSNGGDPALVGKLASAGLLKELSAYGGWNTSGNALGGVVAQAQAEALGGRGAASRVGLLTRLLDDHLYQTVVRPNVARRLALGEDGVIRDRTTLASVTREIQDALCAGIGTVDPDGLIRRTIMPAATVVPRVSLPWQRLFEVRIDLRDDERW